jgi:hypothetical protein
MLLNEPNKMVRECSIHGLDVKSKIWSQRLLVCVRRGGHHGGRECVFVGWIDMAHDGALKVLIKGQWINNDNIKTGNKENVRKCVGCSIGSRQACQFTQSCSSTQTGWYLVRQLLVGLSALRAANHSAIQPVSQSASYTATCRMCVMQARNLKWHVS